MALKSLALSAI